MLERIGQRQDLRQGQNLLQRVELDIGINAPGGNLLCGDPEDLQVLLTNEPQLDNEGKIRYVLAGGWAVEALTGKKREHHDIDIIATSKKPLIYQLDKMNAGNYFQILSLSVKDLLEKHTLKVKWEPGYNNITNWPDEIYSVSPEFLFLSKLAGFMRSPREKDIEDLETLAKTDYEFTKTSFDSLLHNTKGLHVDYYLNKILYSDLGAKADKNDGVYVRGASYLVEIINNFRKGNTELAKKQSMQFHSTLNKIYENGLQNSISANKKEIDLEIIGIFLKNKRIHGFYYAKDGIVDFAVTKASKEMISVIEYLSHEKIKKPEYTFQEMESIEGVLEKAVFTHESERKSYKLFKSGKRISDKYFDDIKLMGIESKVNNKGVIIAKNNDLNFLYDLNGKFLFLTDYAKPEDGFGFLKFLGDNDPPNLRTMISAIGKKKSLDLGYTLNHVNSSIIDKLHDGDYKNARILMNILKEGTEDFSPDREINFDSKRKNSHNNYYKNLLVSGEFFKAENFSKAVTIEDPNNFDEKDAQKEALEILLDSVFYSHAFNLIMKLEIKPEDIENKIIDSVSKLFDGEPPKNLSQLDGLKELCNNYNIDMEKIMQGEVDKALAKDYYRSNNTKRTHNLNNTMVFASRGILELQVEKRMGVYKKLLDYKNTSMAVSMVKKGIITKEEEMDIFKKEFWRFTLNYVKRSGIEINEETKKIALEMAGNYIHKKDSSVNQPYVIARDIAEYFGIVGETKQIAVNYVRDIMKNGIINSNIKNITRCLHMVSSGLVNNSELTDISENLAKRYMDAYPIGAFKILTTLSKSEELIKEAAGRIGEEDKKNLRHQPITRYVKYLNNK